MGELAEELTPESLIARIEELDAMFLTEGIPRGVRTEDVRAELLQHLKLVAEHSGEYVGFAVRLEPIFSRQVKARKLWQEGRDFYRSLSGSSFPFAEAVLESGARLERDEWSTKYDSSTEMAALEGFVRVALQNSGHEERVGTVVDLLKNPANLNYFHELAKRGPSEVIPNSLRDMMLLRTKDNWGINQRWRANSVLAYFKDQESLPVLGDDVRNQIVTFDSILQAPSCHSEDIIGPTRITALSAATYGAISDDSELVGAADRLHIETYAFFGTINTNYLRTSFHRIMERMPERYQLA